MVVSSNLVVFKNLRGPKSPWELKFKGTIVTEISRQRALSENQSHVTHREFSEVSWPEDIDEIPIHQFLVFLISLKILIQPPDSSVQRMYKEYYHTNEIRVERMWSGGGVSLNGSHVTLPKVPELKSPEPVETWWFH